MFNFHKLDKDSFVTSRRVYLRDSAGMPAKTAPATTKGWMYMDRLCMNRRQFAAAAGLALALPVFAAASARTAWADAEKSGDDASAETAAPADTAAEQAASPEPYVPAATAYPLTLALVDGDGTEFEQTFEAAPATAVTLTDSMAEIMCLLGLADRVVGTVTPEATMPETVADAYAQIPQLGDKKTLSRETIVGVGPEVVMGRAMTFNKDGQTSAADYNEMGINVYIQPATSAKMNPTLQGIVDDIKNVAEVFDAQEAASDLVNDLQDRLAAIESRVAEAAAAAEAAQSVLIMTNFKEGTFGTFGGKTGASLQFNMIEAMGATMASTESASGLTYENLVAFNPDVVLYITANRNAETDPLVLDTIYGEPSVQEVPAVANKKIVEIPYAEFMDASPRVFDSAEKILDVLYPQA